MKTPPNRNFLSSLLALAALAGLAQAAEKSNVLVTSEKQEPTAYDTDVPPPTHVGARYGRHERHVLDFWQAPADSPTPLVLVIHGGGWPNG